MLNTSKKKMFFKIHVLYIDEAVGVFESPQEEAEKHREIIRATCERYEFTLTILPLEKIYELRLDSENESKEDMDAVKFKTRSETLPVN